MNPVEIYICILEILRQISLVSCHGGEAIRRKLFHKKQSTLGKLKCIWYSSTSKPISTRTRCTFTHPLPVERTASKFISIWHLRYFDRTRRYYSCVCTLWNARGRTKFSHAACTHAHQLININNILNLVPINCTHS